MFEIYGKHNKAVVFADNAEESAISQIHQLLDNPAFSDVRIRIMPDVHAGAGCVIGFTAQLGPRVVPNLIGVDIGCGVASWQLDERGIDFDKFDKYLRKTVPCGFSVRDRRHDDIEAEFSRVVFYPFSQFEAQVTDIINRIEPGSAPERAERLARVWNAIGTLGGGNHFIEIDRDESQNGSPLWLTIHSGSRNFGLRIATYHQRVAVATTGKQGGLEYLEGVERDQYVADMNVAQIYAALNRRVMARDLMEFFGRRKSKKDEPRDFVESVHNYINFGDSVVRKGAISAHKGERVIIPLTMADGCIIGTGKGVEDWNFSAPHGAGRIMSRSKAKQTVDLDRYQKVMREAHVWSSCIGKDTLDEAPMVYKRSKVIVDAIQATVDVQSVMKPIYNFKAGGE
jgi:tRNA-splicing ligase RtcB